MKIKTILSMLLVLVLISTPLNVVLASESYTILKYESKGSEVSRLQQALKDKGYDLTVDGIYGKATENAVIKFQIANGLRIDGIAGKQTQTILFANNLFSNSILKVGSRGEEVVKLQQALQSRGYYKGTIDGIYGEGTKTAVSNFQRESGLAVDGIAGSNTFAALYSNTTVSRGTSIIRTNYSQDDLYWLSRIIEAEAGSEPSDGKVAVGNVILNRVNSKDFPNTIYDVIFEYYEDIPQFSPVAEGTIYNNPSEESIQAARDALNGSRPVGNSTYFFNPDKSAGYWIVQNKSYVTRIGGHAFYQ